MVSSGRDSLIQPSLIAVPNVKDQNQVIALHEAARSGHTSVVIELLQYDTSSINEENSALAKSIHVAIFSHHLSITRILLNKTYRYSP